MRRVSNGRSWSYAHIVFIIAPPAGLATAYIWSSCLAKSKARTKLLGIVLYHWRGVWHVLFDRFSLIPYLEDFDSNVLNK